MQPSTNYRKTSLVQMPSTCYIEIIETLEDLEKIEPFWEENLSTPQSNIELFKTVVNHRSQVEKPCVFAIHENEKVSAIIVGRVEKTQIPIKLGYKTLFRATAHQLVIIGGGFIGDFNHGVLSAFFIRVKEYAKENRLDLISISQIAKSSKIEASLDYSFKKSLQRIDSNNIIHWSLALPANWDEYLKRFSKKRRYWIKRLPRVLDKEFNNNWKIKKYTLNDEADSFTKLAEQIASNTYHRKIGVGFSANNEMQERIQSEASNGNLLGYILTIENQPCAFWYCTLFQEQIHLNSTGFDPSYRKFELGTILLSQLIADHCGTERSSVDFGLGDANYKQRFASESHIEFSTQLYSQFFYSRILSSVLWLNSYLGKILKCTLDRLGATETLKTYWRKRMVKPKNHV